MDRSRHVMRQEEAGTYGRCAEVPQQVSAHRMGGKVLCGLLCAVAVCLAPGALMQMSDAGAADPSQHSRAVATESWTSQVIALPIQMGQMGLVIIMLTTGVTMMRALRPQRGRRVPDWVAPIMFERLHQAVPSARSDNTVVRKGYHNAAVMMGAQARYTPKEPLPTPMEKLTAAKPMTMAAPLPPKSDDSPSPPRSDNTVVRKDYRNTIVMMGAQDRHTHKEPLPTPPEKLTATKPMTMAAPLPRKMPGKSDLHGAGTGDHQTDESSDAHAVQAKHVPASVWWPSPSHHARVKPPHHARAKPVARPVHSRKFAAIGRLRAQDLAGRRTADRQPLQQATCNVDDMECVMGHTVTHVSSAMGLDHTLSSNKDKLVVVKYSTTSCGPCKKMGPHYSGLADKYGDKATFLLCNGDRWCDDSTRLSEREGVTLIPAFHLHKNGVRVGSMAGTSTDRLDALIAKHLNLA